MQPLLLTAVPLTSKPSQNSLSCMKAVCWGQKLIGLLIAKPLPTDAVFRQIYKYFFSKKYFDILYFLLFFLRGMITDRYLSYFIIYWKPNSFIPLLKKEKRKEIPMLKEDFIKNNLCPLTFFPKRNKAKTAFFLLQPSTAGWHVDVVLHSIS